MASEKHGWMQTLWRPAMGWMYMLICLLDMAVFPVLWALWQGINHAPITQWNPLTLQGAGLFHIAMGAVLGISAFGRTQEKLAGTAVNPAGTSLPSTGGFGSGSSFGSVSTLGVPASGGFTPPTSSFTPTPPTTGGFGSTPTAPTPTAPTSSFGSGFGSGAGTTPATAPAVTASGKKVVPTADQPAL
jgi:hypothetical protein